MRLHRALVCRSRQGPFRDGRGHVGVHDGVHVQRLLPIRRVARRAHEERLYRKAQGVGMNLGLGLVLLWNHAREDVVRGGRARRRRRSGRKGEQVRLRPVMSPTCVRKPRRVLRRAPLPGAGDGRVRDQRRRRRSRGGRPERASGRGRFAPRAGALAAVRGLLVGHPQGPERETRGVSGGRRDRQRRQGFLRRLLL